MLELGTGSGAIAITVLAERFDATYYCYRYFWTSIRNCSKEFKNIWSSNRLTLLQSDWFSKISGRFDIIVSNPPYISAEEYTELDNEVLDYDPKISLTQGEMGWMHIVR